MRQILILLYLVIFFFSYVPAQNIYYGGNDDGFSFCSYIQPSIYEGGDNDGFAIGCANHPDISIYTGGDNDGFSVACINHPDISIYTGGDDDGFAVTCSNHPDITIYRGGENDGFAFRSSSVDIYSGGSNHGTYCSCRIDPLPVGLLSFNAIAGNGMVYLSWATATEYNNDCFVVERSKYAGKWEKVACIDGAGNSSVILHYNTIDTEPYSGISYYRLKQIDYDGAFMYSDIVAVNIDDSHPASLLIYPNPATDREQIIITGNAEELENINIYNVLGQNITGQINITHISEDRVVLDPENLSPGMYIIKTPDTAGAVIIE